MDINLYKPSRYRDRVDGTEVDFAVSPVGDARLISVTVHFDVAPTTSENITVRKRYSEGSEYNVLLLSQDMQSATDLVYQPDDVLLLPAGCSIKVRYPNTDLRTIATMVVVEEEGQ